VAQWYVVRSAAAPPVNSIGLPVVSEQS
jgi:hypothetical protein